MLFPNPPAPDSKSYSDLFIQRHPQSFKSTEVPEHVITKLL